MARQRPALKLILIGLGVCAVFALPFVLDVSRPTLQRWHEDWERPRREDRKKALGAERMKRALGERAIWTLSGATKAQVFRTSRSYEAEKTFEKANDRDIRLGLAIDGYPVTSVGPMQGQEYATRLASNLLDSNRYLWGGLGADPEGDCWGGVRVWRNGESIDVLFGGVDICVVPVGCTFRVFTTICTFWDFEHSAGGR
jgi:hypothetical protein